MEQSGGTTSEVSIALKSIDLNSKENETENTGCFLCQKPDPVKKCSKSHSRCKGNFFCDKNCELSFHKSEKTKVLDPKFCFYLKLLTYALSFYKFQNVLYQSKFFEAAQNFGCI